MTIKMFDEYIRLGIVKKQRQNTERAKSLINEAEDKKKFLEFSLKIMPIEKVYSNFIIDYCYDILMELIRAKMFMEGYNAGNSHEAEVSYMRLLNFNDVDIKFMDELRYNRNGIKYYGIILDKEYSEKVLNFMNKIHSKLKNLLSTS